MDCPQKGASRCRSAEVGTRSAQLRQRTSDLRGLGRLHPARLMPEFRVPRSAFRVSLLACLAALAVAGCGEQVERVYFRPVGAAEATGPGRVAEGKYRLPPGSGQAEAAVSARGTISRTKDRGLEETIAVRYEVQNRGTMALAIDPAKVRLLDDDGHQVGGAAATVQPIAPIVVGGGTKAVFELRFPLPAEVRLDNIGSIRVVWPYTYGEKAYETSTKFIKIDQINYYEPGYYYGGWYYGPYYDPWYGPYGPYGTYGTWSHRYYWERRR